MAADCLQRSEPEAEEDIRVCAVIEAALSDIKVLAARRTRWLSGPKDRVCSCLLPKARAAKAPLAPQFRKPAEASMAGTASVLWHDHGDAALCDSREEMFAAAKNEACGRVQVMTGGDVWFLEGTSAYSARFPGPRAGFAKGGDVIDSSRALPAKEAGRGARGLRAGKFLKTGSYWKIITDGAAAMVVECGSRLGMPEGFTGRAGQCRIRVCLHGGRGASCW